MTQVTRKILCDVTLRTLKPVASQCHGYNRQMINVFWILVYRVYWIFTMTYVVTFNTPGSHDDILRNVWYRKLCVLCTDRFEIYWKQWYMRGNDLQSHYKFNCTANDKPFRKSISSATRSSIQYNEIRHISIIDIIDRFHDEKLSLLILENAYCLFVLSSRIFNLF